MKNPYSKFVKHLEKSERVMIERSGDYIYLVNGYAFLKIPLTVYTSSIRPLSGIFPDTTGDCVGIKRKSDPTIIINDGNDFSPKKTVEDVISYSVSYENIIQSIFLINLVDSKGKSKLAQFFVADDQIIIIDKTFVDMFADCSLGVPWTGAGRSTTAIFQKNDDYALGMLPMRMTGDICRQWDILKKCKI